MYEVYRGVIIITLIFRNFSYFIVRREATNSKTDILKHLYNKVIIWYSTVELSVKDTEGLFTVLHKRDNRLLLVVAIAKFDEIMIN